jgi:hypothetical protein
VSKKDAAFLFVCLVFWEEKTFEKSLQVAVLLVFLKNSFHFVFYITNLSFTYLLCFNDHNYLIGSGSAKEWIATIQ